MTSAPLVGPAWLFCPAHRPERFAKAWSTAASSVILDLEDGTPTAAKVQARANALAWLAGEPARALQPVPALRINALRSRDGLLDLAALLCTDGLPAQGLLLVPKADDAGELAWLDAQLAQALPGWRVCALIESTRGLRSMGAMFGACPRLAAVGFGAADFAAEVGVAMDSPTLRHARHRFVLESAGHPVWRLDVPTLALDDDAALLQDCQQARAEGFHGKFAIHPRQISTLLRAFRPTETELHWARRVLNAYEAAGGGAIQVDGQMVDAPVVLRARTWLSFTPT